MLGFKQASLSQLPIAKKIKTLFYLLAENMKKLSKMQKKSILTSLQVGKYPKAGKNTQHTIELKELSTSRKFGASKINIVPGGCLK